MFENQSTCYLYYLVLINFVKWFNDIYLVSIKEYYLIYCAYYSNIFVRNSKIYTTLS